MRGSERRFRSPAARPPAKRRPDRRRLRLAAALLLGLCGTPGPSSAADPPGWKLTWQDEFDGDRIDPAKWGHDLGNGFYNYDAGQWIGGWGNDELQYYTRDPDNAFVKDGMLHIRAIKESIDGFGYTSARLRTRRKDGTNLFSQAYGRFEVRAKLPLGQGIWPALWLLPEKEQYGGWAASGEIDILETKGQEPRRIQGAIHYGGRWPANAFAVGEHVFDEGSIAEFHVYAVDWDPGAIHWEVDGARYASKNFWWSTSKSNAKGGINPVAEADLEPWPAPFDRPFQILMNLAVGGRFLGNPDSTTPFPAEMLVDYVRVYEREGGPAPLAPRGQGQFPFAPAAR